LISGQQTFDPQRGGLLLSNGSGSGVIYFGATNSILTAPAIIGSLNQISLQNSSLSVDRAVVVSGNITANQTSTVGSGFKLSSVGDIVDAGTGYGAMRFTNGIQIYSQASGGSPVITLRNSGRIDASNVVTAALTSSDYTFPSSIFNIVSSQNMGVGYAKLFNNMYMVWQVVGPVSDGNYSANWPSGLVFSQILTAQVSMVNNTTGSDDVFARISSVSSTGIVVRVDQVNTGVSGTRYFTYFAIGLV